MFGNFKTIRLAISVIVILQFGFLMPLAPVLAQEVVDSSVETSNVDIISDFEDIPVSSIDIILDNKQAADEVFEDILILDEHEQEEIVIDDALFEVVDEFTDVADLGDGKKAMRIYSDSREVYEDERGILRVREDGWNKFNEDQRSKLRGNNEPGYEFSIPLENGSKVLISAGEMEIVHADGKTGKNSPKRNIFEQKRNEDLHTVSSFRGVYTDIDVNFIDRSKTRTKEIIIKNNPSYLEENSGLIFWEEYKIPKDSKVLVGDDYYKGIIETYDSVRVITADDDTLLIGSSIVYDSKSTDDSYCDMSQIPVKQVVEIENGVMRIGLRISAEYLLSEDRVYPVIIDPTYSTQNNTSKISDFYLSWLTGKSTEIDSYLYMGYDYASGVLPCKPAGHASRHPVFKFNVDEIPDGSTVTDADVYLRGTGSTGCGEYNGYISMKPKRINTSGWTYSNITYNNIRSALTTGGTAKSIDVNGYKNVVTSWDIYNSMVQAWVDNSAQNYGFLIEPSDNFSSGSTPPASWTSQQRLFKFYSSNYSSSYSPYLEVVYTAPAGVPDLTSANSSSFNPKIVNPGDNVSIGVTVENIGTGAVLGNPEVYFYLRNSDTCSFTNTYKIGESGINYLQPGGFYPTGISYKIPDDTPAGDYKICFWIDGGQVESESNESNNKFSLSTKLEVLDNTPTDPYEPNDSYSQAEYIGSGTSYSWSDSYLTDSDQDWYKFYYNGSYYYFKVIGYNSNTTGKYGVSFSRSGSIVTIETTEVDTSVDTKLYLYDSNGSSILADDDDGGNSNFSKITYDLNPNQPPNTCSLTSPSNGSSNQNTSLTLDWSCSDSDGSILNYYLQIDDSSNFSSPFYANWLGNANSNFGASNLSYGTTYYWRVKAKDDDNAEGAYNNPAWYFTTKNQPAPGGGSSCGASCNPTSNSDGDAQVETEEANEGLSDNIPNISPVNNTYKKEYSYKNDDMGADPVNLRTGSFELTQTDLVLQGRGENVDFTRYYNSKTEKNARFGIGWKYSYNQYYFKDSDNGKVVVYKGGSMANIFEYDGNKYISPGETDKLYPDASGVYLILEKMDGTKYYYSTKLTNNMGLLEKIIDTNGNQTQFNYVEKRAVDMLTQVVDSSGRSISFTYGDILNDKMWDKITKLTYSTGDPNTKTTVDYIYEELSGGVVALKEVKRTRLFDGQSEVQTDKFTYAKYGTSDIYRLATQEDARGTILYNTYDSEGRTIMQKEYNPNVDDPGTSRLVWTLDYLGEDPDVDFDEYCTLVKNYSDEINHTDQKFCYNSDHLKVYEDNNGNKITYTRDVNGMITNVIRDNGIEGQMETQYVYDAQKRVTKEILPDTDVYHTETWYTYGVFNRVEHKYIYVWDLGEDYIALEANITKHTSYNIDPLDGNILSVTYPDNITESFTYDAYGNVLKHTDKNGNVVNYIYDAGGNYVLTETKIVILPDGSNQTIKKQYQYDEYGNRIKYTSPRNFDFTYEYDTKGNLRQETNPLGGIKTYEYDIENHLTDMYDELNRRIEYIYQTDISASLLQEKKYSLDETKIIGVSTDHDYLGRAKTTYDANGNVTNYIYDGDGRISKKIEPYKTTEFSYFANGNIQFEFVYTTGQSSANWLNKAGYFYDERNNLIETRQYKADGSYISNFQEYDGFGRLIKTTDGKANETTYTYDLNDRLITMVDPTGNTTVYSYDDNGNKTGEKLPLCFADGSKCNSSGYSNSYVYDGANRLIKTINADNKETVYYYNQDGQVTKIIDRQNNGGTSNVHKTEYVYDALGRKTQECDAYNKCVGYEYDAVGNLTKVTDQIGRQTIYNYDDFNRLTSEKDADNNITSYTYDNNGNKKTITYPDNKQTTYTYDTANRLKQVKDHLNNIRTFGYDVIGNKTSETDKLGRTTVFNYDKLNRLTSEINPQDTVTTYTYDNNSNRLTEDVSGKVRTYTYNDLNQLTQISHPGEKTETYSYDAEGNVLTKTDGNNQTINYTYDKLNRLTLKELSEGDSVVYTYDNWDNLLSITDNTGVTNYSYDNNSQQLQEQKTLYDLEQTYTIARTYYADGQLKTLTDASGLVITYEYNNRGLLQNIKNDTQTLASYTYTAQGLPEVLNYDNGTETNYTYDDLHRLSILEITNASSTSLFKHEYSYDAESNRTQLVENDTNIVNYSYDNLEQLTGATYLDDNGNQNIGISYDIWGNRILLNTTFGSTDYNYAENSNELIAYSQNGRLDTSLTYDGNGSLTQESYSRLGKNIRTVNYSWDSQNRLEQIDYAYLGRPAYLPALPNNLMQFAYDDFGNRIKKTVNNESTYYLNNGLTVLNEIAETGTIDKSIVQGLGQIAEIDEEGNIQFIHTDVLGSTVLITNDQGEVTAEYKYDPFGSIVGKSGLAESNYLFTNQEFDSESELYYYNARYYNPTLGRFISRDPFLGRDGDVLSRNSYVYVKNNPLKYVDPTGEIEEEMNVCYASSSNSLLNKELYWEQGEKSFIDKHGTKILDGGQFLLDLVGLVPVYGEPADGINAVIYEARGDHLNAGLSAGSMIPFAGWLGTSGKFVNKGVKYGDEASDLIKNSGKAVDLTKEQQKNLQRFEKKLPKAAEETKIYDLPNGGKVFQADVPANNIPGSKAVYEKQVDNLGNTLQYTKTTYDQKGLIVHVKDKITNFIFSIFD